MMGYGWFDMYLWVRIEVGVEGFENRKKQDVVWVKTLWRPYIHCVQTKI